jgi:hypothetical protein
MKNILREILNKVNKHIKWHLIQTVFSKDKSIFLPLALSSNLTTP